MENAESGVLADDLHAQLLVGADLGECGHDPLGGLLDDRRMKGRLANGGIRFAPGLDLDRSEDVLHALHGDDRGMLIAAGDDFSESPDLAHEIDPDITPIDEGMSNRPCRAARERESQGEESQRDERRRSGSSKGSDRTRPGPGRPRPGDPGE